MVGLKEQVSDLHGNVLDRSGAVLLLVDVINDLDFPDNEHLIEVAPGLAKRILRLKSRCARAGIPTIYVNDNKGRWRSDIQEVVKFSKRSSSAGRKLVTLLEPRRNDYVLLKPKHSIFFGTPLDLILQSMGIHTVIMAGLTTNACVLISAAEIYMRGFRLMVPQDCVEALSPDKQTAALKMLKENFQAEIGPAPSLKLTSLRGKRR
jgi:nicotinamidase-related amidase